MSLTATQELSTKTWIDWMKQKRVSRHTVTYTLSPRHYRLLHRHELPASYELESHEGEDDLWFRKDGVLYNVNEFCRVAATHIPGPNGGAQTASNGYFMIAAYNGKIYGVTVTESKPYGYDERDSYSGDTGKPIPSGRWLSN